MISFCVYANSSSHSFDDSKRCKNTVSSISPRWSNPKLKLKRGRKGGRFRDFFYNVNQGAGWRCSWEREHTTNISFLHRQEMAQDMHFAFTSKRNNSCEIEIETNYTNKLIRTAGREKTLLEKTQRHLENWKLFKGKVQPNPEPPGI